MPRSTQRARRTVLDGVLTWQVTQTPLTSLSLLPVDGFRLGTHYPCSRAVNTAVNTGVIFDTREHGRVRDPGVLQVQNNYDVITGIIFLQCFDAVGWVAGRASGL